MTDINEKIKVWRIDWDGYLVRGTHDVEVARLAVAYNLQEIEHFDKEARDEWFERRSVEVGWWRTNPCICGEGHSFDMAKVGGPGRGNFKGVYFS